MVQVLGCGIDVEELDRFTKYIAPGDETPAFLTMVFTEEEISRNRSISPHLTFPLAFSCKEALFKAFGRSWTNSPLSWKDIEVLFNDNKNLEDYKIRLSGHARELYDAWGCSRVDSSFECYDDHIVFRVLLLSS